MIYHNIVVYIVDENGNKRSSTHTVEKDVVSPVLRLLSSYQDIKTSDDFLTIEGEVEDYDFVTVNNKEIEIEGDHTFKYDYKLKEGINEIEIIAGDIAGNEASYIITAEKTLPMQSSLSLNNIIVIVLAVVVGGFAIFLILQKRKKSEIDDYMYVSEDQKKKKRVKNNETNNNIDTSDISMKAHSESAADKLTKLFKKEKSNSPLGGEIDNKKNDDINILSASLRVSRIADLISRNKISINGENGEKKELTPLDKKVNKMKKSFTISDILTIIIPVVVIIFLMSKVVLITRIESGSMEPTLKTGDIVVYNRLAYKNNEIKRGDVIAFDSKESNMLMGKRVIGLPGDKIEFRDGYIVLNGTFVDETDYIANNIETNCADKFEVPEGCVFVLGDNRENSKDSRFWENPYIPMEDIKGIYMGRMGFDF